MKIRMAIGITAFAASAFLPLAAKPLVWWTMQNDGVNGYWWVIPRGTILMFR